MNKHSFEARTSSAPVLIGWAEVEITPEALPVLIAGQFYARLSEGVADPLWATACIITAGEEQAAFVTCDLASIPEPLRDAVREAVAAMDFGIDPMKIILNATHTHAGPMVRTRPWGESEPSLERLNLGEVPVAEYVEFLARQIAICLREAWAARASGGVAHGLDYAVVGRNRRWVDADGVSTMYNLRAPASDKFRCFEGYEDHSLNLLATYDGEGELTGLIVNIPCPSQEEENLRVLSADFWHETRALLRERFAGAGHLYILPQVSAAGDLTSHIQYDIVANERMRKLRGRTMREEIAHRIADAVGRILPLLAGVVECAPLLRHQVELLQLPLNRLSAADAEEAREAADRYKALYLAELERLKAAPTLKAPPVAGQCWYREATSAYGRMLWHRGVLERYEQQKQQPLASREVHVVRIGSVAFASNPFEYYLDFGVQIKVRSPAEQTFLIQLAGDGSYVPSERSVAGGGYGSVPASNVFGPEAGQIVAEKTVEMLRAMWC